MNNQIDLYTVIHKSLRNRLFQLSIEAGKMNFGDRFPLNIYYDEFKLMYDLIESHRDHEEKYIHPLLNERVPGGSDELDEDHQHITHLLDNLLHHLNGIKEKSIDFEKRIELGQEFYLAFNRFISFFIDHINKEEEEIMPLLKRLCTNDELLNSLYKILASQTPQEAKENLTMIFKASNVDDLTQLFNAAKKGAPIEMLQNALKLAEGILDTNNWAVIKSRFSIDLSQPKS